MTDFNDIENGYEDIINLPHHVSDKRPHMSLHDRAAQFAPFAALTGYGDAIDETARYTGVKRALSESERDLLDKSLSILKLAVSEGPEVSVVYFEEDLLKEGGAYEQFRGHLKKIDDFRKTLVFSEGKEIAVDDILSMDSELFDKYEL